MSNDPWYQNGLQFQCTQCGDCCSGAPGYVWVNKEEIASLAELAGEEDIKAFEKKYVRKIGIRKSLVERKNGDCIFLHAETRRCTVYQARPRQCRNWPFWDSNIRSEEDWARTCADCPGAGTGRVYTLEEIETQRQLFRV